MAIYLSFTDGKVVEPIFPRWTTKRALDGDKGTKYWKHGIVAPNLTAQRYLSSAWADI